MATAKKPTDGVSAPEVKTNYQQFEKWKVQVRDITGNDTEVKRKYQITAFEQIRDTVKETQRAIDVLNAHVVSSNIYYYPKGSVKLADKHNVTN